MLTLLAACSWSTAPVVETADPNIGIFHKLPANATTDDEIAALEAIGYVGGEQEATARLGVTVHDRKRATPGLNFWVSGHGPVATLMDMDGTVLHTWEKSYSEAFPGGELYSVNKHGAQFWRRAYAFENGDLLAIFEGHGLVKLDKDSNVLWRWDGRAHHDLEVLDDGNIWVLSRRAHVIERMHPDKPVLDDFATLLSADGKVIREISLLEAMEKTGARSILDQMKKKHGDLFHTNSLALLDGRAAEKHPAFKAGNLLLSMRTPSALFVLDPEEESMVWWKRGRWRTQHDPKILDNGNMLLYDNAGHKGRTAVRELQLPTMREVWSYHDSPEHPLYSKFTGMAQRFPGGNTLIAESRFGRVLEVTPEGTTVWEFHNPHRAGKDEAYVAIIPEMIRLPIDYAKWLETP